MQNCQRCHSKEAIIICMQCESFKYLCEKCDNYIHNLPGKKSHNRISILLSESNCSYLLFAFSFLIDLSRFFIVITISIIITIIKKELKKLILLFPNFNP